MDVLLRAIGHAIFAVDLAGRITYLNPAAQKLGGKIGQPLRDVIDSPWQRAVEEVRTVVREEAVVNNHLFSELTSPVVENGRVVGAVVVARDISAHRVELRKRELRERFQATSALAAALAHQMNNPLAVATVHAELLREELDRLRERNPNEAGRINDMFITQFELERAVHSVAQIIADLRTFSNATPSSASSDLRRCIEWAVRVASPMLRDRARAITRVEADGAVAIDEPSLGNVLAHLITNASHAIAPGAADRNQIAIRAFATATEGKVAIEVRDTGVGLASDRQGSLFDPTFTPRPQHVDIGLGLPLCRDIVERARGTIEVESIIGQGTTVRITLPFTPSSVAAEIRAKILVVDDDAAYVRSLQRALRNHEVSCCTTASDALAEIGGGTSFDVILANVDLAGTELYQSLLIDHPGVARRVVFVAQTPTSPSIQEFLAATPNRWFEKPIPPSELRTLVKGFATRI